MSKISIGRGFHQQRTILSATNTNMAVVAKQRIEQVVSWQNQRHIEALKVQGSPLKIWVRNLSGQKCTCGCNDIRTANNPEKPFISDDFDDIAVVRKKDEFPQNDNEPHQAELANDWDFDEDELLDDMSNYSIGHEENSLIYGGDKTPCGICLGTGYKDGYQMYNGQRIILDYWNQPIQKGFMIEKTYPISYVSDFDSSSYIIWNFHAPTFFKEFLGCRVRNNVTYCKNYSLQVSFDGTNFVDYSDDLIKARNGIDTQIFIKVIPYHIATAKSEKFSITHIEFYYQIGDYVYGDFAPIENTENFEFFEALQSTNLELAGDINCLDRESVILDEKNQRLWKVISITPHMTEARQIFKNETSVRMIQKSENLYCLMLLKNPNLVLNYRGLEVSQGKLDYGGQYHPSR